MAHDFKKLSTNSAFPNIDNVEVYKFDNDFDYSRYDYTQMNLQICTVPWDMGEAHIGNRTISGIGNVVYFGSKEKRNAWFDAIPDADCYRFSTKFKELHRDLAIDVPIPYDVCAKFNYLKVHYSLFANDDSPVMYEDDSGLRDWFWFIREVEFVAPNTTRLHLMDDAFQTWIYDVQISGMILERGHAPMFAMKATEYLENPIENCTELLTDDVNFGEISQVKHIDVLALNDGNMYACIATSANPRAAWGSKADDDWRTPASSSYTANGNPSFFVFAVPVANLADLLANITTSYPQFKQTVQGVFFASSDLITLGNVFTFAGIECHTVSSTRKQLELSRLRKGQFGYDSRYADIAKLYTSPYAHIEVTDENGDVDIIRVEDTTGELDVSIALSIAYPFVNIDAHLLGAGGNASANVTYRNITSHTFSVAGQWYDTLRSWKVPTFAVVLDAASEYDYSTHYDRLQRVTDYETAYANASASASTSKADSDAGALAARDNAYDSADTAKANADASADTAKANADASADTAKSIADASADTAKANADASATTARANVATIAAANKSNTDDSADASATNVATIAAANKANADDSATTARTNTATVAAANKANADASADLVTDNALLATTANTAITNSSNASVDRSTNNTSDYNFAMYDSDNAIIAASATSTIEATEQQAAISAASGAATAVTGAIANAATGNIAGAISSAVNGVIGGASTLASTAVSVHLKQAEAAIAQTANQYHGDASTDKTLADATNQKTTANGITSTQNTLTSGQAANSSATTKANATRTQTAENTAATATETTSKGNATRTQTAENTAAALTQTTTKANAARTQTAENTAAAATETTTKANAARTQTTAKANATSTQTTAKANATSTQTTTKANAARTQTTAKANAKRSYDTTIANNQRDYDTGMANANRERARAQSDIANDILQAALRSPFIYGEFADGESSANKPMALFANIVTQSKSAISSAGDEFLRYGYRLDKYWEFDGDWNIGKYFTYWKLRDFWVVNLNVPDMYMDKLRFFLFGGVTVWRKPEDIGRQDIYGNFN